MPIESTLKEGHIVVLKRGKHHLGLVVRSEHRTSHDTLRGESYWVDEFDIVPLSFNDHHALTEPGIFRPLRFNESNVVSYHLDGNGGLRGNGYKVSDADIRIIGQVKVERHVEVTFTATRQ